MTDSTLNRFLASGTNAQRLAFVPDPPAPGSGPDPSYIWTETDTGDTFAWDYGGAAWQPVGGGGSTTALSTSLSQVSSSLSSEISSRASGDTSLSTVISSEVSSRASGDTSLSTVVSGSISTANSSRASGDVSLSTIISSSISTTLSTAASATASLSAAIPAYSILKLAPTPYAAGAPSNTTLNINSTSYIANTGLYFTVDLNTFPFEDFRIIVNGQSNAGGQTITAQLATFAAPATPIHSGGNDLSIPNGFGTYDSGWKSRDDAATGLQEYGVTLKGSNATVDLQFAWVEVHLRIT